MSNKGREYECWGESKTLREWSEDPRCLVGLPTLHTRTGRGASIHDALTTSPIPKGKNSRPKYPDIAPAKLNRSAVVVLDQPTRITNSSSREPYTLPVWNVRAGADDHLQHRSIR